MSATMIEMTKCDVTPGEHDAGARGQRRGSVMYDVTDRQEEVLRTIERLTTGRGYPPTIRELAAALEIRTTNGIKCHLESLKRKGLVEWETHQARTLRLTDAAKAEL